MEVSFEIAIIGSGVIGCAISRSLSQGYNSRIAVIEKENIPAYHTSGRNSGVIHSGFNLKPGTLKARFCVEGNRRLRDYCNVHGVPMHEVGTIVVALNEGEYEILKKLEIQGNQNGVEGIRIIDEKELREREPYANGMAALYSPTGSIISSRDYVNCLAEESKQNGVQFFFNHNVKGIKREGKGYRILTNATEIVATIIVNCAGLHADRIAAILDVGREYRIIPFRGEYYELIPEKSHTVNSMIYPPPNPELPFLGVHFTKTVEGRVIVGPNAVFAFAREGYSMTDISMRDIFDSFSFPGFRKLFRTRFLKIAFEELYKSLSARAFAKEAKKLMPTLRESDLVKGQRGIRAQLVNKEGHLIEDFVVEIQENTINVLNTVSPGLTSSLPFGDYVADMVLSNLA